MIKREIDKILIKTLKKFLPIIKLNIPIIRLGQDTKQGQATGIYFDKISTRTYGYGARSYDYDTTQDDFDLTETRIHEVTYRISVMVSDNTLSNANVYYSDDPLTICHRVMDLTQSLPFGDDLRRANVSPIRTTDILINQVIDFEDNYINIPTFTLTLNYQDTMSLNVPCAIPEDLIIHRI